MENIERPAKDSVYFITTKEFFIHESNWSNFISVEYEANSSSKLSKGNLR